MERGGLIEKKIPSGVGEEAVLLEKKGLVIGFIR